MDGWVGGYEYSPEWVGWKVVVGEGVWEEWIKRDYNGGVTERRSIYLRNAERR